MRTILLAIFLILTASLVNAATISSNVPKATYTVQSKWNGGQYVNIFYDGGGSWQAVVGYTLPMAVDNITNGTTSVAGNVITYTPGSSSLQIGTQLRGDGDADPARSYVLVNGQKIPFTGMPIPPQPILDTYHIDPKTYLPTGTIQIGQVELPSVWDSGPFSIEIPNERKQWAMALAHAAQIFKNVTQVQDLYTGPNHYLATVIQESHIGADPLSASFTYRFPISHPITYVASADTDGFFQIEGSGGGSAFKDLQLLFPNRFGNVSHDTVISGPRFSTSAIASAYFNIYMYQFLVGSGWKPHAFFAQAKDPQALDRVMALVYNRGAYSNYVSDVFTSKRLTCINLANMADDAGTCLPNNGDYGSRYVRQVPGFNKALVTAASTGVDNYPGKYDADLTWNDISAYLDSIAILYSTQDITQAKQSAQAEFNRIATNGQIKFATQFGTVLDKIMLSLSIDNPANSLCKIYAKCEKE